MSISVSGAVRPIRWRAGGTPRIRRSTTPDGDDDLENDTAIHQAAYVPEAGLSHRTTPGTLSGWYTFMAERRYTDEETAAIFKAAAELQQAALTAPGGEALATTAGDGMTLAQLQEIGREVGIPSELVVRAAQGLERRGRASVRRLLGLPIGVGRTVALHRTLTEAEWERLVVDLRETFDARGRLRTDGSFRQWTNGNLQALLEPTPDGDQLRLRTVKGQAYRMLSAGVTMLALDALLIALRTMTGRVADPGTVALLGAMGLSMIGLAAFRTPWWAKERLRQMEGVANRLTESTADSSSREPT